MAMRRHRGRFVVALDGEVQALEPVIEQALRVIGELDEKGEQVRKSLLRAERDLFELERHQQEWKAEIETLRRRAEEREEEEAALRRWSACSGKRND
jgi:chromosome segregation ATPase